MRYKMESFFYEVYNRLIMVAIYFLTALIAVFTGELMAAIQTGMG